MSVNTNKSLLQRAKLDPQSEAWFQLNNIYDPLIAGWIVRAGVEESEVSDIAQEVMQALAQDLENFEHNGRQGAFRSWLKTVTINRCRRYWDKKKRLLPIAKLPSAESATRILNELEDPGSDVSDLWDSEHDSFVLNKVMQLIQREFDAREYEIFVQNCIKGESAKSISDQFEVTVGNVYKIKFRVLKRLKEAAEGLLDDNVFTHMGNE